MTIRNNYAVETIIAFAEGFAILAFIVFLFLNIKVSLIALAVFLACLPLRNFVKYGKFYPRKAKPGESDAMAQSVEPLVRPAASGPVETI